MATHDAQGNSLFVVDSPDLIAKTADSVYRERDDIRNNELVATPSMVSVRCEPQQEVRLPVYSDTQCPAPLVISSPCIAYVHFPLRSTFKSDVTVLHDGQCEVHFSYDFVTAQQLENGDILVNGGNGGAGGSQTGDCATLKPYLEIEEAIALHQNALMRESAAITQP